MDRGNDTRSEEIRFPSSTGVELVGTLDRPPKPPEAYALVAHCFTGGREHPATRRISRALAARGLGVLRFDFSGLGDSAGEFATSTFSDDVDDLARAADWLRDHHGAPSLLVGHSLGGAAALAAAHLVPEVAAVATIAAPHDPAHVLHLFSGILDDVERDGIGEVVLAGQRLRISRRFVTDLRERDPMRTAVTLERPLLILHSPDDELVGIENANHIYRSARHPKSFLCLDGADHLLTRPTDAERAAQLIAAWADPYLPESFTPEID